jgi:hypothetical protein
MVLRSAVKKVCRRLPRPRRRLVFSDRLILSMLLWAVMHNKPLSWACDRSSYSSLLRPRRLPSTSQYFKRLKTGRFVAAMSTLHDLLTRDGREDLLSFLDGKALLIGEYSSDPDASTSMVGRRFRLGYKLHARATVRGFIAEYRVLPLHEGEPNTARELLERVRRGSVILADANFDSSPLYEQVDRRGATLLTRIKGTPSRTHRRLMLMSDARRAAIWAWRERPGLCEAVLRERDHIERVFAHLTCSGTGLGPLPAWVRRLSRVRLWVDAKIAIYHARILARRSTTAA